MSISKDRFFSTFLVVVAVIIVDHLIPPSVNKVVSLTLSKSDVPILSVDQERKVGIIKEYMIDEIDLSNANRFSHPVLGVLGWTENFFADVKTAFTVSQSGFYRFEVGSDDGFDLRIDENSICSFKRARAFKKRTCRVRLEEGKHSLHLSYFQGYGNAGLTLKYSDGPKGKMLFWGVDSDFISYQSPK